MNIKKFTLYNKTLKAFSISIYNFASALTLLGNVSLKVGISYVISFLSKATSTITIKKVRLTISKVSILSKITQTLSAKRISILSAIKEAMKVLAVLENGFTLVPHASLVYRVGSSLSSKLQLTATIILAEFNTLFDFDPDTLGDMDIQTLGDLDYALL